jgi:hypothetical protein
VTGLQVLSMYSSPASVRLGSMAVPGGSSSLLVSAGGDRLHVPAQFRLRDAHQRVTQHVLDLGLGDPACVRVLCPKDVPVAERVDEGPLLGCVVAGGVCQRAY